MGDGRKVRYLLSQSCIRLGRSPFNDLTFDDPKIARNQLELRYRKGAYTLVDSSGRGTKVNGRSASRRRLKPGDIIQLGDIRLVYAIPDKVKADPLDDSHFTRPLPEKNTEPTSGRLCWKTGRRQRHFEIEGPVFIGASDKADIQLEDDFVSKNHCQLEPGIGGLMLRDLMSTNGTWIDSTRIIEALIAPKTRFKVGRTEFLYEGSITNKHDASPVDFFGMIGRNPDLLAVQSLIRRMAPLDETVLILGESGTGKELVARALHTLSPRKEEPFVTVNCAALSPELIESELFGHEKGAFTGAGAKRTGAFEAAASGTIFLDEIGELPLALQPKLLRTLDSGEVKPVGSSRTLTHRARVLTATNRNLRTCISDKRFRGDLYFRLSSLPIELPPLRNRNDDISLLVDYFLSKAGVTADLDENARQAMCNHSWPGNIRELKNVLTTTLCYHPEISIEGLIKEDMIDLWRTTLDPRGYESNIESFFDRYSGQTLQEAESELICEAFQHFGGNKRQVCLALNISKSTLYGKIRRYKLKL